MAYVFPLLSSLVYVAGVLSLKSASSRGAGIWTVTIATNLVSGLVFSSLLLLGGTLPADPVEFGRPALVALLFLVGQLLGFLAVTRGDVSVATPVMGIKVVLVAFFTTLLLGERLPWRLWAAAGLSSAGILFLGRGGTGAAAGRTAPALVYGITASAAFAAFDVLVQKWSPAWGIGRFLPIMMGLVAIYSVALGALLGVRPSSAPPAARGPLLLGAALVSVQALSLIGSIAWFGRATPINVVYSVRGLWSVIAVWTVGHWFGNEERHAGAGVLGGRLAGAALLTAAVVLAVLS
jgi:drug/metabolite transporter (DMT)-like permease